MSASDGQMIIGIIAIVMFAIAGVDVIKTINSMFK
jgi:hypothetical protein